MTGKPAPGIPVELVELANLGESRVIARAVTNADGRTDQPLIGGRPLPIGRYELKFSVAKVLRRAQRTAVRPAVPRRDPAALRDQRARRPLSRSAAGHAVELFDLSRQLGSELLV